MEPQSLANGSPFLLTVKAAGRIASIHGQWMGQELSFFAGKERGGEVWYALAGVDVETVPGSYPLTVETTTAEATTAEATAANGKSLRASVQIQVGAAKYRTSAIRVPENFVTPDAATQAEIAADKAVKDRVFAQSAVEPEWSGDFVKPVHAAATDSFGTRRTFNGKLANIHRGMDFRASSGTPVAAANSGTVVLAQKLFYEGNCVAIDHGQGFRTIYMHLSRIDVAVGDRVRKGQRLGLSGATGRVTGPHLHFAVRWQGADLDPAGLFRLGLADRN